MHYGRIGAQRHPLGSESINIAKHIGGENFVYIARNEAGRPLYADVSEYRILPPEMLQSRYILSAETI